MTIFYSLPVSRINIKERAWEISLKPSQHNLSIFTDNTPNFDYLALLQIKIIAPDRNTIHQDLRISIDDNLILEIVNSIYFHVFFIDYLFLLFWLN